MSATASLINQTIGNYRVSKLLGEGGMGVVYLAQHPVIGRKVAIKLLHAVLARDQDIVSRFFNEARAIHMIAHENIVEILDFGQTTDGQPYFIMEYLEGESLSEVVGRGAMSPDQVTVIGGQMCRALGAAHAKGIVHRDLKPHNVQMITKPDGTPLVKILDFGVAKILASPDGAQSVKTRTGSLMGTPLYMSPEQCKGAGTLDHRTDIYSLGVMLFEMLAGRPPFTAEGVGELFAKHMLEEAPQLSEFAPQVPAYMTAAIMRSLQKEPRDRFESMEEFRKALVGEVKLAGAPARAPGTRPSLLSTQSLSSKASTTLSSASSEIDGDLASPQRSWKVPATVGGLAAAAIVAFLVVPKGHKETAAPVTAAMRAPAPAPPPLAPPAPKTVTLRFEADPVGAHLFAKQDGKKDGKDLGEIPVELQLPKGNDSSDYLFKLAGYRDVSLTAKPNANRTLHVSLEKIAAPTPPPQAADASKHHAAAHHAGGKKTKSPVDEDGLATPSF
ncbi:MAG TPA: serine/threonine-protein kinase [Polyangia bacterium]|nr:serine/threonine-protein kinase [Polyangia bacterium]